MPYPGLLHPEPLPLCQFTADLNSTGDTQTKFCLSLTGVSGSWCIQSLFQLSECLWQVWGLIVNTILPNYHIAGASALGYGVSPHICSSTVQPGKGQFSFQSQRKAMPKNVQTTTQLHSSHMIAKKCSNSPSQASTGCEL